MPGFSIPRILPGQKLSKFKSGRFILKRASRSFVRTIDSFIEFLDIVRALILRDIQILSNGQFVLSFPISLKVMVMSLAHAYLWAELTRSFPLDYLNFTSSGFCTWYCFANASRAAKPRTLRGPTPKNENAKWIYYLISGVIWSCLQCVIGFYAILGFYSIFMHDSMISTPDILFPDISKMWYIIVISGAMGTGFGLLTNAAKESFELFEFIRETMTWLMYITSGIFMSYSQLPYPINYLFSFNPQMTLIENFRNAESPTYPVSGLPMSYPIIITLILVFLGFAFHGEFRKAKPR